jgi:hypothetical protein
MVPRSSTPTGVPKSSDRGDWAPWGPGSTVGVSSMLALPALSSVLGADMGLYGERVSTRATRWRCAAGSVREWRGRCSAILAWASATRREQIRGQRPRPGTSEAHWRVRFASSGSCIYSWLTKEVASANRLPATSVIQQLAGRKRNTTSPFRREATTAKWASRLLARSAGEGRQVLVGTVSRI